MAEMGSSKGFASPFSLSSLLLGLHPVELLFPLLQKRVMHNVVIWVLIARHAILRSDLQKNTLSQRKAEI